MSLNTRQQTQRNVIGARDRFTKAGASGVDLVVHYADALRDDDGIQHCARALRRTGAAHGIDAELAAAIWKRWSWSTTRLARWQPWKTIRNGFRRKPSS